MATFSTHLCDASESVLVVVDIQSGLLPVLDEDTGPQFLNNAKKLILAAGKLDIPVLVTEQYPQGLGQTIPEILAACPEVTRIIEKRTFSAFAEPEFKKLLAYTGRKQAILCGAEAHVCVLQTAIELHQNNVQTFIVEDAICSRKNLHRDNAIRRMAQTGINISNVESVIFEWLADSRHTKFREISKELIR